MKIFINDAKEDWIVDGLKKNFQITIKNYLPMKSRCRYYMDNCTMVLEKCTKKILKKKGFMHCSSC